MRIIFFQLILLIASSLNAQELGKLWEKYYKKEYNVVLDQTLPLLKDYPDNMELNLIIGRSYVEIRNPNQAIPYLKKVIENDIYKPDKAWSMAYLGYCYFYIDSINLAKKYLNSCINLNATKNATTNAYSFLEYFSLSQFYDSWTLIETNNIRFHFQNSQYDKEYVKSISKLYTELNKFFNAQTTKKIDIYIWENPSNYSGEFCYSIGGALIDFLLKNGSETQLKEILKDQLIDNARKVYKDFDKLMGNFNEKISGG